MDPIPELAAPEAEAPPPPRSKGRRPRRSSRLVFESALIVLSVLLGFAMSEWRQRQGEREVASVALANFHREITDNLATLERVQSKHAG